jgi:hypothetical protein
MTTQDALLAQDHEAVRARKVEREKRRLSDSNSTYSNRLVDESARECRSLSDKCLVVVFALSV